MRISDWSSDVCSSDLPAPQTTVDAYGRRCILHQDENAAAHVAPVGLQQKRCRRTGNRDSGLVGVLPPVAAMRCIPDRIGARWLAELRVMRRDQLVVVSDGTEHDAWIPVEHRIVQRRSEEHTPELQSRMSKPDAAF